MLAVGRELLIGRTLNTNAQWMGLRLARRGSLLAEVTTVDDDLGEISAALRGCLERKPDLLVVVGGLGPTPDDMTLKGIARGAGRRLRLNPRALELMKEHYAKRGMGNVEMTPARLKMAKLPSGAAPLVNPIGTAPGVMLELGGTRVYCLPGVPSEMKAIFRGSVEPAVAERVGTLFRKYVWLKVEGIYESVLAPMIGSELRKHPGAYIKSHPRGVKEGRSRIELDVAVVSEDPREAEATADAVVEGIGRGIADAGGKVVSRRETPRQRGG